MLHSTSLRRPATGADDAAFDPASTAPPVVSPADPFAPPAVATPSPSPLVADEIEPDDDEIVILSTGGPEPTPTPAPAPERPSQASPAKPAAKKAPARKTVAKKATARKAAPATGKKATAPTATSKKAASKRAAAAAWVEPKGGICPTTHPVKAKLRSAIFHLPGMAAYARTSPDRCYRDEAAALGDGLRRAAR
jgi:outer membrane biosynthesis protein TonB